MGLVEQSAVDLRRQIGERKISPVELMQACIDQIEKYNPAVNAICATDYERAMAAAREAEAMVMRGAALPALHGLPLGVKDLQATAGLLTTSGNVRLRGYVPERDLSYVARLRQAGAIVTAKTNTPDMGAGANSRNPVWGATGNPFNPARNAGGSSGGSAAALACDMLPLCTGSDTGGSLRIPSALCGVVGLRPSPGLIANDMRPLGWSAISVLGPMGRDVADTAFMMQASVGPHPMDPLSLGVQHEAFWPVQPADLRQLRVAYTEDFGACAVDPMIRRVFRERVQALSREVAVCEALDWDLIDGHRCFDVIRAESFFAAFEEIYRTQPETLGPNVRANVEMAASITLADRAWAHLAQTRINRLFQSAFEHYDLILSPVTPLSPFPWTELYAEVIDGQKQRNYYEWLSLTYMVTLATNPALSLPLGRDEAGMPFGLQMIGSLHRDAHLLRMAAALEQWGKTQAGLSRPLPDMAALQQARPELKSIVTHPPIMADGAFVDTRNAV
jgi:Asp-tRNA(Asn)/Glu-tRNA(Gln) amidotransferase A subunit family amidase